MSRALKFFGLWVAIVIGSALLVHKAHAAGDLYMVATIGSKHLGDTRGYKYNERNFGFGVEYYPEGKSCGAAGGGYENSYSRTSIYALGVCRLSLYRSDELAVRVAAGVGIISGYRMPGVPHIGVFVPAGNLSASIESRSLGFGVNTVFIPKACHDCNAVVGLQLKKLF